MVLHEQKRHEAEMSRERLTHLTKWDILALYSYFKVMSIKYDILHNCIIIVTFVIAQLSCFLITHRNGGRQIIISINKKDQSCNGSLYLAPARFTSFTFQGKNISTKGIPVHH